MKKENKDKNKLKMRLTDIISLNNAIAEAMNGKSIGLKVSYALDKNLQPLQKELALIEEAKNSNERFKEFQKKRIALTKKYSVKDKNGKPTYVPKSRPPEYDIADMGGFTDALEPLKEEYKDVQSETMMEEELVLSCSIFKISIREFPMDFSIQFLRPILKETDEEIEKYLYEENKAE